MARLTNKATSQLQAYLAGGRPSAWPTCLRSKVATDVGLRDRLLLEAAADGASLDVAWFRRSIAGAVRATGTAGVGYPRTSAAWAKKVSAAIDRIRPLAAAGQTAAVVEVCDALGRSRRRWTGSVRPMLSRPPTQRANGRMSTSERLEPRGLPKQQRRIADRW